MKGENEAPAKSGSGVLKRSKGVLKVLAILLAVAAILAWIALGIGLYMDVGREVRIGLAVTAAVATEALFWIVAALLGVSVADARKRIWRRVSGRAS